ncbi:MAG: radical SAM protein [Candidatus Omnitrophota bacterium]
MKKILFVNPNYFDDVFDKSKARAALSRNITPLGLICAATPSVASGHAVELLDLNSDNKGAETLAKKLRDFKPDIVGITATTATIKKAYDIADMVKQNNDKTIVIVGGAHASAMPAEVLNESSIDCVAAGEGDFTVKRIAEEGLVPTIANIYFKQNGSIIASHADCEIINDLDQLPFPAYQLLDIKKYNLPNISSRKGPVGYFETSRGCYGKCIFCNKNIHGSRIRYKSPERVVDEMDRMRRLGYMEMQIIDDVFNANIKRACEICELIIKRDLKLCWYTRGGLRVDTVSLDLFKAMKKAGCYRVPFGIESGSQRILDVLHKGITLDHAQRAVSLAKKAGLETECYFVLGSPTETEDDIKKSIDFALKLNPDYVKFAILIPYPGTALFDTLNSQKRIKTKDWSKYNFAVSPKHIYEHDVLSWDTIDQFYIFSHKKYYFRLNYILSMALKTIYRGTFAGHAKAFIKTRW